MSFEEGTPIILAIKKGSYKIFKTFKFDHGEEKYIVTDDNRVGEGASFTKSADIVEVFYDVTAPDDVVGEMEVFETQDEDHDEPDCSEEVDDEPVLGKLSMAMGIKARSIKINNDSSSNIILTTSQDPNSFVTRDMEVKVSGSGAGAKVNREGVVQCTTKTTILSGAKVKLKVKTSSVYVSVFTKSKKGFSMHRMNRMLSAGTTYSVNKNAVCN